ncbi:MAG TPA: HAD family phosphatase [Casimicrobiaceae bacterium]|nr:HAD family phosphatase [Casimicrobiaceae bacterium]
MFHAAIFDMDGLLIDSERAIMRAWIDAARDCGITLEPEAYADVVGRAEPESNAILVRLLGGGDAFRAVRSRAAGVLSRENRDRVFPLKSGVRELLVLLRSMDVLCAVASSSAAAEIRHRLGAVDVLTHFGAVAGGDEVPRGKPDPAVYQLAAARLGVPASACLAFEDSENGARAALAAGAQVVLVPDLRSPPDAVTRSSVRVLGTLTEALAYVPGWFAAARDA